MSTPMMKCGHAANAKDGNGNPCCVICFGLNAGANVVDDAPPALEGRTARCTYGPHGEKPSSPNLPFFRHRPAAAQDTYYCGCYGWD